MEAGFKDRVWTAQKQIILLNRYMIPLKCFLFFSSALSYFFFSLSERVRIVNSACSPRFYCNHREQRGVNFRLVNHFEHCHDDQNQ